MKIMKPGSRDFDKIVNRFSSLQKQRLKERVEKMLREVRVDGDEALLRFTRRFDGVKLTAKSMKVSEAA